MGCNYDRYMPRIENTCEGLPSILRNLRMPTQDGKLQWRNGNLVWNATATSLSISQDLGGMSHPYRGVSDFFKAVAKEPRWEKVYQSLKQLTDSRKNFAVMREVIGNTNPPVIPYLGYAYLSSILLTSP